MAFDDEEDDPAPALGWGDRLMFWLRLATQVVGINLLMLLGTLAGLVVAGLFPALAAGGVLLAKVAVAQPSDRVWSEFWREWRDGLGRMNSLALPWWLFGALLLVDLQVTVPSGGSAAAALIGLVLLLVAYLTVVFAFFLAATRRYDDPFWRTWRFLLVSPLLAPGTALFIVFLDAVLVAAFLQATVLIPLVGLALPIMLGGWLADRRLDRIEEQAPDDSV